MNEPQKSASEAHGIKKLNDYLHLRMRTEMYLGSRSVHTQRTLIHTEDGPFVIPVSWVPALLTAFREVIDNSLDEFTKANIKSGVLRISYDSDTMTFVIEDNGRGIPIDWDSVESTHLASMVMSELKAGRNFEDSERQGVAGMNGLGGSCVTNISEFFELKVVRAGRPYNDFIDPEKEYTDEELDILEENAEKNSHTGNYEFTQVFEEGEESLVINDPMIKKTKATNTGTTITFTLSSEVFKEFLLPDALIESLLREIAAVNTGHKIYFNGTLIKTKPTIEKTLFSNFNTIKHTVTDVGFNSTFYVIPNAISEDDGGGFMMHGLVNNIPVYNGGRHLDAFKEKFALGLIKALEKESKKRKLKPNRGDVEEGVLLYNNTVMDAPFFNSQSKTQLINDETFKIVEKSLDDSFFEGIIRKNKVWIDEIYTRTASRTNKKDMDEANRQAKKNLRKKVAKLEDAHWAGKASKKHLTRLIISEGDSAAVFGDKDNNIYGMLPLRGKILNVADPKIGPKEILASQSTADIMNALGLIPGEKADRTKLRYNSLIVATDMDHDGASIAALVTNFIYKYWPELFDDPDNPFVYFFMTPFIICHKGKQREYFYLDNYDDFDPEDWGGWGIRRAKGLGTLQSCDVRHSLNELRVIPIINNGKLNSTLDLIFNKSRADDRKQWLMDEESWEAFVSDRGY